jgi:hypothetical protein
MLVGAIHELPLPAFLGEDTIKSIPTQNPPLTRDSQGGVNLSKSSIFVGWAMPTDHI